MIRKGAGRNLDAAVEQGRQPVQDVSADAPRCPQCDYLLIGLGTGRCPECGKTLHLDLELYRPSLMNPWSSRNPIPLRRGFARVLVHPGATFKLARGTASVSTKRAVAFAVCSSLLLIAVWPLLRLCLIWALGFARMPFSQFWVSFTQSAGGIQRLGMWSRWTTVWTWEAWSLGRWWLFFGILTLLASITLKRSEPNRSRSVLAALWIRLLVFAPWILLLEFTYLVGVWIYDPHIVPEPNTLFHNPYWQWSYWLMPVWLIRGVLPSFVVQLVYFRYVLGRNRWMATLAAIVMIPLAVNLSVFWSILFLKIF